MCDGVNAIQSLKGDLLIEVKEQSRYDHSKDQLGSGDDGSCTDGGRLPCADQLRGVINDEGNGSKHDS